MPFWKPSSLINKTLVIQKTVGVTDGWCFFSYRPVSRKIIEACVLMSRKKPEGTSNVGDGCRQTRCYPPDYWKTFLSVAQKDMWREKGSLALIQTIRASFLGALGLPPLHLPRCALERCSTQIRHQYSKCGHGSFGSHKKMMPWTPLFFIF